MVVGGGESGRRLSPSDKQITTVKCIFSIYICPFRSGRSGSRMQLTRPGHPIWIPDMNMRLIITEGTGEVIKYAKRQC